MRGRRSCAFPLASARGTAVIITQSRALRFKYYRSAIDLQLEKRAIGLNTDRCQALRVLIE